MSAFPPPVLADLEELVGDCHEATRHIIESQTASETLERLEAFRDSLAVVKRIEFALKDWIRIVEAQGPERGRSA